MPVILDLPSELLEIAVQYLLQPSDRAHLASLRLSCRHVEAAIRRSFQLETFKNVAIRKPKDANVERFYAITKTTDLAKSVKSVNILCADDGTAERHQFQDPDAPLSLGDGCECLWPSGSDELVPATLIDHKETLLAAFLATKNLTELECTDYHHLSKSRTDNVWEYSDLPAPRPRKEPTISTITDQTEFVCDISSTVNIIMSLVARAGLSPKSMSIHSLDDTQVVIGLTSAICLVTSKQTLLQLDSLELVFVDDLWNQYIEEETT
ncbi:hypothetical protein MBLNU13_g10226t1 [Cladosporium sp. NU13]